MKLGIIEIHDERTSVRVRSISGLQAINVLAAIPEELIDVLQFPVKRAVESAHVFFALEAEYDFDYAGHVQSDRRYPDLSNGRGISSFDGMLTRTIEIIKPGSYQFMLSAGGDRNRSSIVARLTNIDSGRVFERKASLAAALPAVAARPVVTFSSVNGTHTGQKKLETLLGVLPDLQSILLDPVDLTAGHYLLEVSLQSQVSNLSTIYGIRAFNPKTLPISSVSFDIADADCSSCESVSTSMISRSIAGGILTLDYEPTCSCDWYIVSSPSIGVEERDEYLLRFDLRSDVLRARHIRVLFLDVTSRVIGVSDIPETEEIFHDEWASYEHIVEAPRGANRMLFQIWGRGDRVRKATLQLRGLSILPTKDLPMVDVLYAFESDAMPALARYRGEPVAVSQSATPDGMKRQVAVVSAIGGAGDDATEGRESDDRAAPITNRQADDSAGVPRLFELHTAESPLWRIQDSSRNESLDLTLNGFNAALMSTDSVFEMKIRFRYAYYVGLVTYLLNFLAVLLLQWFFTIGPSTRSRVYAMFAVGKLRFPRLRRK